jgi:hypothetical protein
MTRAKARQNEDLILLAQNNDALTRPNLHKLTSRGQYTAVQAPVNSSRIDLYRKKRRLQ